MTKPNFSQMARAELRAYVLAHREDDEAIAALISRHDPAAPKYPFPKTDADLQQMTEILKKRLG